MTNDASSTAVTPSDAGPADSLEADPVRGGGEAEDTPEPVYLAVED